MKSPEAGGHDNIGKLVEVSFMWKAYKGILIDEDDVNWYIFGKGGKRGMLHIVEKTDWMIFKVLDPTPIDTAPYRGVVHNIHRLYWEGVKAG